MTSSPKGSTWILVDVATGRILTVGDRAHTIYGYASQITGMRPPTDIVPDGRVSLSVWRGEYAPSVIGAEWRQVPLISDEEEG